MSAQTLGEIMTASAARARIQADPWNGVAVYMLWNRELKQPIYCGKSEAPGRLLTHLSKDNPLSQPSAHNLKNPDLTRYWQSQPAGWLGVSYKLFKDRAEASAVERQIIEAYGIRRNGGPLYNQR